MYLKLLVVSMETNYKFSAKYAYSGTSKKNMTDTFFICLQLN